MLLRRLPVKSPAPDCIRLSNRDHSIWFFVISWQVLYYHERYTSCATSEVVIRCSVTRNADAGSVWRQRLSGRRVRSCLCPCKDRAMLAELRLVPYGQEKSRLRHRLMEQLTESTIQGSFDFVDELHVWCEKSAEAKNASGDLNVINASNINQRDLSAGKTFLEMANRPKFMVGPRRVAGVRNWQKFRVLHGSDYEAWGSRIPHSMLRSRYWTKNWIDGGFAFQRTKLRAVPMKKFEKNSFCRWRWFGRTPLVIGLLLIFSSEQELTWVFPCVRRVKRLGWITEPGAKSDGMGILVLCDFARWASGNRA